MLRHKEKGYWQLEGYYCLKTKDTYETQPNINWDTLESEENNPDTISLPPKKVKRGPKTHPEPDPRKSRNSVASATNQDTTLTETELPPPVTGGDIECMVIEPLPSSAE